VTLAQRLAQVVVDLLVQHRGNELIAAHADVAVDLPGRHLVAVGVEGALPGDRVVVVGVDERAVDVENQGERHPRAATRLPRRTNRRLTYKCI